MQDYASYVKDDMISELCDFSPVSYTHLDVYKRQEISVRNRKRNVRGRTDGKMPERAGRNVRI